MRALTAVSVIATRSRTAYLPRMVARRLVRFLTMLALLLAPLGMVGQHAAMAIPGTAQAAEHYAENADHCAGMSSESEDEGSPNTGCLVDCAVACSAIPALGSEIADQPIALALAQRLALISRVTGLHPESDPPPPRIA